MVRTQKTEASTTMTTTKQTGAVKSVSTTRKVATVHPTVQFSSPSISLYEVEEWQKSPKTDYTYAKTLTYVRKSPIKDIAPPNMARDGIHGNKRQSTSYDEPVRQQLFKEYTGVATSSSYNTKPHKAHPSHSHTSLSPSTYTSKAQYGDNDQESNYSQNESENSHYYEAERDEENRTNNANFRKKISYSATRSGRTYRREKLRLNSSLDTKQNDDNDGDVTQEVTSSRKRREISKLREYAGLSTGDKESKSARKNVRSASRRDRHLIELYGLDHDELDLSDVDDFSSQVHSRHSSTSRYFTVKRTSILSTVSQYTKSSLLFVYEMFSRFIMLILTSVSYVANSPILLYHYLFRSSHNQALTNDDTRLSTLTYTGGPVSMDNMASPGYQQSTLATTTTTQQHLGTDSSETVKVTKTQTTVTAAALGSQESNQSEIVGDVSSSARKSGAMQNRRSMSSIESARKSSRADVQRRRSHRMSTRSHGSVLGTEDSTQGEKFNILLEQSGDAVLDTNEGDNQRKSGKMSHVEKTVVTEVISTEMRSDYDITDGQKLVSEQMQTSSFSGSAGSQLMTSSGSRMENAIHATGSDMSAHLTQSNSNASRRKVHSFTTSFLNDVKHFHYSIYYFVKRIFQSIGTGFVYTFFALCDVTYLLLSSVFYVLALPITTANKLFSSHHDLEEDAYEFEDTTHVSEKVINADSAYVTEKAVNADGFQSDYIVLSSSTGWLNEKLFNTWLGRRIYRVVSSVLVLDTWLLRRKGCGLCCLLPLILLLPLLLSGAYYLHHDDTTQEQIRIYIFGDSTYTPPVVIEPNAPPVIIDHVESPFKDDPNWIEKAEQKVVDIAEKVVHAGENVKDKIVHANEDVIHFAGDVNDKIVHTGEKIDEKLAQAGEAVRDGIVHGAGKVADLGHGVKDGVIQTGETVTEKVVQIGEAAKEKIVHLGEAAKEKTIHGGETVVHFGEEVKDGIIHTGEVVREKVVHESEKVVHVVEGVKDKVVLAAGTAAALTEAQIRAIIAQVISERDQTIDQSETQKEPEDDSNALYGHILDAQARLERELALLAAQVKTSDDNGNTKYITLVEKHTEYSERLNSIEQKLKVIETLIDQLGTVQRSLKQQGEADKAELEEALAILKADMVQASSEKDEALRALFLQIEQSVTGDQSQLRQLFTDIIKAELNGYTPKEELDTRMDMLSAEIIHITTSNADLKSRLESSDGKFTQIFDDMTNSNDQINEWNTKLASLKVDLEAKQKEAADAESRGAAVPPVVQEDISLLKTAISDLNQQILALQDSCCKPAAATMSIEREAELLSLVAADKVELGELRTRVELMAQQLNSAAVSGGVQGEVYQGLTEQQINGMITKALATYHADRTGKVDYALESAGGSVISIRCSETYPVKTAQFSVWGVPLWYASSSPRSVIQPDVYPGQCWAMKGNAGFIVIQLAAEIELTEFSIEHIPRSLAPEGNISSAPRDFSVWGLEHLKDYPGQKLGDYTYQENGDPIQNFPVQVPGTFSLIELRIHRNWGHPSFTCLYRFRVHGKLKSWHNGPPKDTGGYS